MMLTTLLSLPQHRMAGRRQCYAPRRLRCPRTRLLPPARPRCQQRGPQSLLPQCHCQQRQQPKQRLQRVRSSPSHWRVGTRAAGLPLLERACRHAQEPSDALSAVAQVHRMHAPLCVDSEGDLSEDDGAHEEVVAVLCPKRRLGHRAAPRARHGVARRAA